MHVYIGLQLQGDNSFFFYCNLTLLPFISDNTSRYIHNDSLQLHVNILQSFVLYHERVIRHLINFYQKKPKKQSLQYTG